MSKKIYITTPIYYASGKPHIGHAFSTILAHSIVGYKKMLGYETLFLGGMDEHGQKIADKAKAINKSPQTFVDEICDEFTKLWNKLGTKYDCFVRTSNSNHCQVVQKVFSQFFNAKFIYLDTWKGLYCVQCEENYTLGNAIKKDGELYCKVGHKLTEKFEESYFLKLSMFQEWLENFYVDKPKFIIPTERLTEIRNNFIKEGIEDLSITRTTFDWGIPVIENKKHVIYVWIDALMSYLTGLGFLQDDDSLYQKFWNSDDVERVHIVGKEITRFHGIYWPIMLKMLNVKMPTNLLSHGWIVTKEGKMSKSLGNVVDPIEYIDNYGRDALRYFLLRTINTESDGIFSHDLFISTYNTDLANNYGNFISRTLGMLNKYTNGIVPKFNPSVLDEKDKQIINEITNVKSLIINEINNFKINNVLAHIMNINSLANKYIEDTKPWTLKSDNQKDKLNSFLTIVANVSKTLTYLLSPVLIDGTSKALEQLNLSNCNLNFDNAFEFNTMDELKVNLSSPIYVIIKNKK